MKRIGFIGIMVFLCAALLCGCQKEDMTGSSGETVVQNQTGTGPEVFSGKVVEATENGLMLAGKIGQTPYLISLSLDGLELKGPDGMELLPEEIQGGMRVEVEYDGAVLESYPSMLSHPARLRMVEQEDDIVGLYLAVLRELWQRDEGLNSGISQLAFDLTEVRNLSPEEKNAFIWLAGGEYGLNAYASSFDELKEQGAIVDLYWEDGLLITFKDEPIEKEQFTFQAEKWRSGLGAYYFSQCTAQKEDGEWRYTVETEAIS